MDDKPSVKVGEEVYVVEAILGSRIFEGVYQYEVSWEGEEETTWHNADTLSCYDLIDEFEINNM